MRRIAHVTLKEFAPLHKIPVPVNQVVDGNRVKPLLRKRFATMRADVPCPAGDQDIQDKYSLMGHRSSQINADHYPQIILNARLIYPQISKINAAYFFRLKAFDKI